MWPYVLLFATAMFLATSVSAQSMTDHEKSKIPTTRQKKGEFNIYPMVVFHSRKEVSKYLAPPVDYEKAFTDDFDFLADTKYFLYNVGVADFSVPNSRKKPGDQSFDGPPKTHFRFVDYSPMGTQEDLEAALQERAESRKLPYSAIVFVHGFRTSLKASVLSLAQLWEDSAFPALPVVVSWPNESMKSIPEYKTAIGNSESQGARDVFSGAIATLQDLNISSVSVVAHSMGGRLVAEPLRTLDYNTTPASIGRVPHWLTSIALVHSEIVLREFQDRYLESMIVASQVLVNYCAADGVLWAARQAGTGPHLGTCADSAGKLPGVENVKLHHSWDRPTHITLHDALFVDPGALKDLREVLSGRPAWQRSVERRENLYQIVGGTR